MIRKVLPSITTAGAAYSTWRKSIDDLYKLQIEEFALFLTGLNKDERTELYLRLERVSTRLKFTIPFVHARADMDVDEYEYLIRCFGTRAFNLHPTREFPLKMSLPKSLRKIIYIENTTSLLASDLKGYAGICADISHAEDYKRLGKHGLFGRVTRLIQKYRVGASHVSAVTNSPYVFKDGSITYAPHRAESLVDFSYLLSYPKYYFGKYIAIELENSIAEQLQVKEYIEQVVLRQRPQYNSNWASQPVVTSLASV